MRKILEDLCYGNIAPNAKSFSKIPPIVKQNAGKLSVKRGSIGTRLTPGEVLPHMKAHAMNGESHSCQAY